MEGIAMLGLLVIGGVGFSWLLALYYLSKIAQWTEHLAKNTVPHGVPPRPPR